MPVYYVTLNEVFPGEGNPGLDDFMVAAPNETALREAVTSFTGVINIDVVEYRPGGPVRTTIFGTSDLCDAIVVRENGEWVIKNTDKPVPASEILEIEDSLDNDAANLVEILGLFGIKPWTD